MAVDMAGRLASVQELRAKWEQVGGDSLLLQHQPALQEKLLQRNHWQEDLSRAMKVVTDAEIFVTALNDNAHKNKCKELEVQGLLSSLLLGVAGAGLFATTGLNGLKYESATIISFCVSVFCYMAAAIMSGVFLLPFLSTTVSSVEILQQLGYWIYVPCMCRPSNPSLLSCTLHTYPDRCSSVSC